MNVVLLLGRIFYSAIFIMAAPGHFSSDLINLCCCSRCTFPWLLATHQPGRNALSTLFFIQSFIPLFYESKIDPGKRVNFSQRIKVGGIGTH